MNGHPSIVELAVFEEHRTPSFFNYTPRDQSKWWRRWTMHFAFWLLDKLGNCQTDEINITRHIVDCEDVVERLFQNEETIHLLDRSDENGGVVFIGPDEYRELTSNPDPGRSPLIFDKGRYHWGRAFNARPLRIVMLPWMNGTLIVPRRYL